jgi:hypothetical protein
MAYIDQANLAQDTTFLKRVAIAVASFANFILAENPTTDYHTARFPWALGHAEITLRGTEGRVLVSLDPLVPFFETDVSSEDTIILEEDLQVVSVRASFKEIAADFARHLFAMFNWNDPDPKMIDNWQTKLLERRI